MLLPEEARLLDRLTIEGGPRATEPAPAGSRRVRAKGFDLEFHEYRHYQAGDDPRSIDWNVDARLGQLVVRVSRAQGHVPLHVLVDVSASMSIGAASKIECARKVAAALLYVAIARRDPAGLATFDADVVARVRPADGRPQLFRLFEALGRAGAGGRSSIDRVLERYAAAVQAPGLVVVLSDFYGAADGLPGVRALLHRGLTPALIQVVAAEETDPELSDVTELMDAEDVDAPPVVVDARALDVYRARMAAHSASIRAFCLMAGLRYVQVASGGGFRVLLPALESAGMFVR